MLPPISAHPVIIPDNRMLAEHAFYFFSLFLYSTADFFSSSNASENFFETMPGLPRNISRFVKSFRKVVSSGRCRFTPNFERRSNSSSRLRFNLPLGNSSFARSKRFSIPFTSSSRRCTKPALVLSTLWFHSFCGSPSFLRKPPELHPDASASFPVRPSPAPSEPAHRADPGPP